MSGSASDRAFRIVVLAALAGIGVVLHQTRGCADDNEAMRELAARIEAMEAVAAAPGYDTRFLSRSVPTIAAGSVRAGAPQPGAMGPVGSQLAEKLEEDRRRELRKVFAAQGVAPAADGVPQQVIAAFGSDGVVQAVDIPQSQDVKCKADMCLIRATFKPGTDSSDWATRVMLELGEELPSYSTGYARQPDGGYEINLYAARKGK